MNLKLGRRNSRWTKRNTRFPLIKGSQVECFQKCTGRQHDELVRAGTIDLRPYRKHIYVMNGIAVRFARGARCQMS